MIEYYDEMRRFYYNLECARESIALEEEFDSRKEIACECIGAIELVYDFGWISTSKRDVLLAEFLEYCK